MYQLSLGILIGCDLLKCFLPVEKTISRNKSLFLGEGVRTNIKSVVRDYAGLVKWRL